MVYQKYHSGALVLLGILSILLVQVISLSSSYAFSEERATLYVENVQDVEAVANQINPRQLDCMSEAIYFEARGQPIQGQKAVAHVIMNRVRTGFAKNVCGVIHQKSRGVCQFSYYCENVGRPRDSYSYNIARKAAVSVMRGENDFTRNSTYYHADYVNPYWAKHFDRIAQIGDHIFYSDS